ncbi:MAG: hypothetical protein ACREQP_12745 [Candidatus Binatia bacterium]
MRERKLGGESYENTYMRQEIIYTAADRRRAAAPAAGAQLAHAASRIETILSG